MAFIEIDGRRLYFEQRGRSGPLLVLLNGLSQSTANWRSHAAQLSSLSRVLLYDARGQGKSELGAAGEVSLAGHVADLRALLDACTSGPVYLCGFSHGARIALAYAAAHPRSLSGLVLTSIGADAGPRRQAIIRSWAEVLELGGLEALAWSSIPQIFGSAFLERGCPDPSAMVRATVERNSAAGIGALLTAMRDTAPPIQDASDVRCPTLLITASEDQLVSPSSARHLADAFTHIQHERLEGCGHTIPIERPLQWRRVLGDWLFEGAGSVASTPPSLRPAS